MKHPRRRQPILATLSTVTMVVLAACAQQDPAVLASFSSAQVTVDDLSTMIAKLPEGRRAPQPGEESAAWLRQRVEDIALERYMFELASESGLADEAGPQLSARFRVAQQLAQRQLAAACPAPEVGEAELRELFRQQDLPGDREWILLRHIYKRSHRTQPVAARAAIRAELGTLRQQLADGASFVELARLHSDSETAADGGLIGRVSRQARIEPAVLQAAWALDNGSVSPVVEVQNGFHLLRREESGVEPGKSFEELEPALRQQRIAELQQACVQDFVRTLEPADSAETLTAAELDLLIGEAELGEDRRATVAQQIETAFTLAAQAVADGLMTETERVDQEQGLWRRSLVEQLWNRERRAMVTGAGEDPLRQFYAAHPERFVTDVMFDVDVIGVSDPQAGQRAVHERALRLRQQILDGGDFHEIARRESTHPSAADGGALGEMPLPQLTRVLGSEAAAKVAELGENEISVPLLIQGQARPTYAMVRLRGQIPSRQRTFEESREQVAAAMAAENAERTTAELRQGLLKRMSFQPNTKAIQQQAETWASGPSPAP